MSLFYGNTEGALVNREFFLKASGIDPHNLVCARQVHASTVKYVTERDRGRGAIDYASALADTDGMITDKPKVPLAIFSADCLSVFIYDPKKRLIGLIHAGWRSSRENILGKTIQIIRDRFSSKPQDLLIGFGPAIRPCCYEVKEEFMNYFGADCIAREGRYYLDLVGVNIRQGLDLGVKNESFFDSGACTYCRNDEFFSYRKEGESCGRLISVMMMR